MRTPPTALAVAASIAVPRAALAGDLGATVVSIVVPSMVFLMVLGIVLGVLYAGHRETREKQETLRLAIEKGLPIPQGVGEAAPNPDRDLRTGIRLVFVGLGVGLLLYVVNPFRGLWAVGAMIAIFGAGHLVSWWATRGNGPTAPPALP
jgi:hypothetical protein